MKANTPNQNQEFFSREVHEPSVATISFALYIIIKYFIRNFRINLFDNKMNCIILYSNPRTMNAELCGNMGKMRTE